MAAGVRGLAARSALDSDPSAGRHGKQHIRRAPLTRTRSVKHQWHCWPLFSGPSRLEAVFITTANNQL